jgi:hypothetical protein
MTRPITSSTAIAAGLVLSGWLALAAPAQTTLPRDANAAVRWESLFERDKDGFTIFPLGQGAKLILVSSSDGSDFNDGLLRPVRTMQKALSLVSNGYPDRILFKRGDVFVAAQLRAGFDRAGRSILEPMILGAYGDQRQPRPILESGLSLGGKFPPRFLVIQSLDFYASQRDTTVRSFDPERTVVGQDSGIFMFTNGSYLWIEDCAFRFFGVGMVLQSHNTFHTLIIRRCTLCDSYSNRAHSQGIYVDGPDNVLIEENVFDHNGWNESVNRAGKTIFNHNMYLQHGPPGEDRAFIVRDNISARASSHGCQLRPGGLLENNLFLKDPLAAFVADSPSVVRNNVILDSDDIGPANPRGQGLEFLNCPTVLAENNVIAHKNDKRNGESGLAYDPLVRDRPPGPSSGEFRNNVVWDWAGSALTTDSPSIQLNLHDNYFQQDGQPLIHLDQWREQYQIRNNHYQLADSAPFMIGQQQMDLAAWCKKTGDTSSSAAVQFVDPGRDISTYAASIGLKNATLEGFLAAARQQRRGHWDSRLTAAAVNDYIRAGFEQKSQ